MKASKRLVALSSTVLLLGASLYGCATSDSDDSYSVSSLMDTGDCTPSHRDVPGREYVKIGITEIDAQNHEDDRNGHSFILSTSFSPDSKSGKPDPVLKTMPFEFTKEISYVSGVHVTTTKNEKDPTQEDQATQIDSSMLAVGLGGYVGMQDLGDKVRMHLKFRDAALVSMEKISIKGKDGSRYTVQQPYVKSVNKESSQVWNKQSGVSFELHDAANGRQLLVQRCWYKVPERKDR